MADEKDKKGGLNIKALLVGLPVFIIQLVAVYFITANILLNKYQAAANKVNIKTEAASEGGKKEGGESEESSEEGSSKKESGKFLFSVDEVIINPSGTDGKRLLLASIGFDLNSDAQQKELKEKEILVKDIVISVLSSKNLTELNDVNYKDTLKIEIKAKMKEKMPKVKVNDVYFSKYIIQ
jgi:flagellar protein FliL